jgi:predicted dehydrogenase
MNPVRVGVLGSGNISTQYLDTLSAAPEVDLIAIGGRNTDSVAGQAAAYSMRALGTSELLKDKSIELIVNLTPPQAHVATSLQVLRSGKHLWSEKPLATSVQGGREILAIAERRGLRVGSAPDTFLGPGHQSALSAIRAGQIGTPRHAEAVVQYWGPDAWHPNPDFLFAAGGGPLHDMGPYWLTLILQALGPVRSVVAEARISRPTRTVQKGPRSGQQFPVEVPTHVVAVLDFENEATASCVFSFEASSRRFTLSVSGDKGEIEFADPNQFFGEPQLIKQDERTPLPLNRPMTAVGRGMGVVDMARAIRSGQNFEADGNVALSLLVLMEAIDEAGRSRARVTINQHASLPNA